MLNTYVSEDGDGEAVGPSSRWSGSAGRRWRSDSSEWAIRSTKIWWITPSWSSICAQRSATTTCSPRARRKRSVIASGPTSKLSCLLGNALDLPGNGSSLPLDWAR